MASDRLISISFIGIYIGLTTNVGNAYTSSLPPVGGYTLNGLYNATFNVSNTSSATLDGHNILVNGLGLIGGTIVANADNLLRWNGTSFNLMVGAIAGALGPAGGDLSGTYPNPTVSKLLGVTIGSATAASGNILISTASQWNSTAVTGDITLTSGGLVAVTKINGVTLGSTAASTPGNLLIASGSSWVTQPVSGDVTMNSSGVTAIGTNKVTNAQRAQMAANTFKSNLTGALANEADNTVASVKTALSLTGTNSGDVTLTAVGASPNANGASLSSQVLTLQPADSSNPGLLTTTLYTAFNKNVGLLNSANITVPAGNTIANTTTTTKFTSQPTLPASVVAGSVIRWMAAGVYSTTLSPLFNFQMLLGAIQLGATGFVTAPTAVTNQRFVFELTLIVIDNTHVEVSGTLRIQNAATTEQVYHIAPTATIAVTSVNSGVLALQFSWGTASASDTVTLRQMICEIIAP